MLGTPPYLWQKSRFVRRTSLRSSDEQNAISATCFGGPHVSGGHMFRGTTSFGWDQSPASSGTQVSSTEVTTRILSMRRPSMTVTVTVYLMPSWQIS